MGKNIIDKAAFFEAWYLLKYNSLDSCELHIASADEDDPDDRPVYYAMVDGVWGSESREAEDAVWEAIRLRDATDGQ